MGRANPLKQESTSPIQILFNHRTTLRFDIIEIRTLFAGETSPRNPHKHGSKPHHSLPRPNPSFSPFKIQHKSSMTSTCFIQCAAPKSYVCWFTTPSNYGYNYIHITITTINPSEMVVINQLSHPLVIEHNHGKSSVVKGKLTVSTGPCSITM